MRILVTALALMVSGCGESPNASQSTDTASYAFETDQPTAPADNEPTIRKVSDAELATALGSECPSVTKSEYKGKTEDQVFYAVQCGTRATLLGIKFDGSTKGVPCNLAETLKTPCWRPWPDSE